MGHSADVDGDVAVIVEWQWRIEYTQRWPAQECVFLCVQQSMTNDNFGQSHVHASIYHFV